MPKPKPSAAKDFIAGGVGGVCTVVAGHPLDTIKVNNSDFVVCHFRNKILAVIVSSSVQVE